MMLVQDLIVGWIRGPEKHTVSKLLYNTIRTFFEDDEQTQLDSPEKKVLI